MDPVFKVRIKLPRFGIVWERVYTPESMQEGISLLLVYRHDNPQNKYRLVVEEI